MSKDVLCTIFVMLFFSLNSAAQTKSALKVNSNYVHQFIYELHTDDAKDFVLNNPLVIEKMKSFLERNIYFIQYINIPNSITLKLSDYEPSNPSFVQQEFDVNSFNPFLYGFEKVNSPRKVHIDGTNYVLFINPTLE